MTKSIFDYAYMAKKCSYGSIRTLGSIRGLVIHYTGNAGDSAKNNALFFSKKYGSNERSAGAHIFIDGNGVSAKSVPFNRTAWSVGNPGGAYAPGTYNKLLNNANTLSIELCDIVDHPITDAQRETLLDVCAYIAKKCKNIKYVVRHFDIVQKDCPHYYVHNQKEWLRLQSEIMFTMGI